jgi:hypothetical protein
VLIERVNRALVIVRIPPEGRLNSLVVKQLSAPDVPRPRGLIRPELRVRQRECQNITNPHYRQAPVTP